MGLNGAPAASTPLRSPTFSFAADAQTWIRYALQLEEGHKLQLRHTEIDNAPYGRDVHWNSAWAWAIAGAGELRSHFTREPLPLATERAALWLNGGVLLVIVIGLSAWTAMRAGALAGTLVAFGIVGCGRFYEGFVPTYVDHHGLLTASVFGMMLGIVFMGVGYWQSDGSAPLLPSGFGGVRSAAVGSAICGAIGLWISAASVVPPIAFVGIAGLVTTIARGRVALAGGAGFDARSWRVWGTVGSTLSLFFYALEYAPAQLGMRLEVNHPLYAFAWWAGAEMIAQVGEWWLGLRENTWGALVRLLAALIALITVPTVVLIGRAAVFLPMDPFLASLHHDISEFLGLPQRIALWGWGQLFGSFDQTAIALLIGIIFLFVRRDRANVTLWFSVVAATAFVGIGLWQERWLLNASGPLICVTLVTIVVLAEDWRLFRSPVVVLLIICLLFVPTVVFRLREFEKMASGQINGKDALQPLFRNIAAALRASQPKGDIIVLASPNTSTSVGYYGRFKTIGTLYWENDAGLKAAAAIFSAHTDDEAAKLIKARGITHIAMVSEENFLSQYYTLLHPHAAAGDVKKSFGYRLLAERQFPSWLEVLPYTVPIDLKPLGVSVFLFKVVFNQTVPDALYHLAVAQVAWGSGTAAEQTLDQLIRLVPNVPQPYLRKFEILVSEGKFGAASAAAETGIPFAAAADRRRLYMLAGTSFFEHHAPDFAVQMYRRALDYGFDPLTACDLAWILATNKDAGVRRGSEALRLATEAVNSDPNSSSFMACLAAALAENGRFAEAADLANKAIAGAGANEAIRTKLEQQLATYREQRPWRE